MGNVDPIIGKEIAGKFKVIEKIGAGGMATVYKAVQKNLDRFVALKIINQNLVEDDELIKRFIREAQDMAKISHPNVVTVYDFGNDGNIHFIAMEYLEGQNLSRLIRQEGRQDEFKTVKFLAPIADALEHIHRLDFIHRDVKSSNIFITNSGRPVLMDFGIAYHSGKTISDIKTVLGTAEYMSPEQTKGSALDVRSDLYSLGIVIYECLTGNVPFHGDSLTSTIYKVNNEEAVPPGKLVKLSSWLNTLVISLLKKKPKDRLDSARQVFEILEQGLNTGTGRKSGNIKGNRSTGTVKTKARPKSRKKVLLIVLLILILVVLPIPVVLWMIGIIPAGGGAGDETKIESVQSSRFTPAEIEEARIIGEDYFAQGNIEEALKYFNRYLNDKSDTATISKQFLEARNAFTEDLRNSILSCAVPSGEFLMGVDSEESDGYPQHKVYIDSFNISAFEISLSQYVSFLNVLDCNEQGYIGKIRVFIPSMVESVAFNDGEFECNWAFTDIPAYGVTWQGAELFCSYLGGRLPTEAEWEYAARGLSNFEFSGSNSADFVGWYKGNATGLMPCGKKQPNDFGIYDMNGNVWEWCSDFYSRTYYEESPVKNPTGPTKGDARVIRGGDIKCSKELITNGYRSFMYENTRNEDFIGFRFCR